MFDRTLLLINENILNIIKNKSVLLVGIGGVGGASLEALVRLGFHNITIVDHDTISNSNLNRQIITNQKNLGHLKVNEAQERYLSINPKLNIKPIAEFVNEDNINEILTNHYDYIIDACDTITTKFLLIREAEKRGIKIISSMGTGNRFNPQELCLTSLDKTYNDPLAKAMRSICTKNKVSLKVPVVWSRELPLKTNSRTPGSLMMVPTTAGMLIAYYILEDIKKMANFS